MSAPDLREFEVELRATVVRKVEIRAASHHEAAALARTRYQDVKPIEVTARFAVEEVRLNSVDADGTPYVDEEWEVYTWCEACDRPIFTDDDYYGAEEYICGPCHWKAVASAVSEDA